VEVLVFKNFVRVLWFSNRIFWASIDLHWFRIYISSGMKKTRGVFRCFTCVLFGDLNWKLRTPLDPLLFVVSLAWIHEWTSNSSSFFFSGSKPWNSFPLLLLRDRAWVRRQWWWIRTGIAKKNDPVMMFVKNFWGLMNFLLICVWSWFWKILGFVHDSWWFSVFWSVTE